ncbi:BTB/POZ domain-containing protein At1g67900-like [Phragmites australis]|uniref:BTB/POZ domain-containing protein At1g67900-like n=1 Tax=Phragmites australis TaxID=29695 RepID=UPI002D789873|nr:BTB/POZ domain-containing protein At1g67900-like [Phragmites australis]
MKLMKLGTRPDTFFTSGPVRSVHTEVTTDLQIQVDHCLFRLHKFPLLSKSLRLQALCAESGAVELPDFPGGAEAFEACAKFCYGITFTIGAHNVVAVRCAAGHLGMTEAADRGNLAAKLDAFLASCLLRRWKDALTVLRSTGRYATACEEFGITSRCVDAVAAIITDPRSSASDTVNPASSSSPWWARDVSQLGVDLFWRVMVAVKAAGTVHGRAVGDALKAYVRRWLPNGVKNGYPVEQPDDGAGNVELITKNNGLLVEKIVSLLPAERNAVSCSFLLKLLKAANILGACPASKAELTRRVALQLEDANVSDLLIPSVPATSISETLYDVDAVMGILDEFALRQAAAAGIPEASPARAGTHRRSRSVESVEFDGARRSTSAPVSHGAMVRIGRLVDGFLIEVTKDPNLPLDKLIAIAEAVPDCARPEHDDLYRAVDTYLRVHPEMDRSSRKKLCRVLNCRKLSETASTQAAQNELLPLRVIVQVLFFENARATALSGPGANSVANQLGGGVKALRAKSRMEAGGVEVKGEQRLRGLASAPGEDDWSVEGLKRAASRTSTLRMKLEEDEDDEAFVHRAHTRLVRSASSRVRAFCAIPTGKPRWMLSRLWPSSRAITERH